MLICWGVLETFICIPSDAIYESRRPGRPCEVFGVSRGGATTRLPAPPACDACELVVS